MQKKIITKTDSNLITLQYKEVTEEAIIENELLVKELIFILKSGGNAISKEDLQKINDYNIMSNQVSEILKKLDLIDISQVESLIEKQDRVVKQTKAQLEAKTKELEVANQKIEEIKNENEILESKYQAQKNRKIVRLVDKVAKR